MSCKRTQGFLAKAKATVAETVDAKKHTIPGKDALRVLDGIDHLYAAKGKNVVHVDLTTGNATKAELAALIVGPSGNLRAPTVRKGKTLLVGFDEATYARLVK